MASTAGPKAATTTGAAAPGTMPAPAAAVRPAVPTGASTSSPSRKRKKPVDVAASSAPPAPKQQQQHVPQQFAPAPQIQHPPPRQPPLYEVPQSAAFVPVASDSPDLSNPPNGANAPAETSFPVEPLQGLPSVYIDGRVRNPIPSKLKGALDGRGGSFGVMHIDLQSMESRSRDEAAKQTSLGTERAAKMASQSGYVSLAKRKQNNDLHSEAHSQPGPAPAQPEPAPAKSDAAQTKEEQARLLTLLRTLNPVSVVDQLCKAVTFFGGVPGAPVGSDAAFPESAYLNGSGRLFVNWIAEIFPKLTDGRPPAAPVRAFGLPHEQEGNAPLRPVRPRGRPKGSKTKPRSDKAAKKTTGKDKDAAELELDDGWVDVEESTVGNAAHASGSGAGDASGGAAASRPKKRGRPKGSKNRPKEGNEEQATGTDSVMPTATSKGGKSRRPKASQHGNEASQQSNVNGHQPSSSIDQPALGFALSAMHEFGSATGTNKAEQIGDLAATQTTAFRPASSAANMAGQSTPVTAPSSKAKRKRKTNQDPAGTDVNGAQPVQPLPGTNGYAQAAAPSPAAAAAGPPPGQPPAKRQRNGKAPNKPTISATERAPPARVSAVPLPQLPQQQQQQQQSQQLPGDAASDTSDAQIDRETFEALQSQLEQEAAETVRRQEQTSQAQQQFHAGHQQQSMGTQAGTDQMQGLAARQQNQRQQQSSMSSQSVSPLPLPPQVGVSGVSQQPTQQQQQHRSSYYTPRSNPSSFGQQPHQQQHSPQQQTPQFAPLAQGQQQQSQPQPQQYAGPQQQHQHQNQHHQQPKYPNSYAPQPTPQASQQQQQAQQYPPQTRHPQQQSILTSSPGLMSQAASDSGYRTAANNAALNFNASFASSQRGASQPSVSPSLNAYASSPAPTSFNNVRQQQQAHPSQQHHQHHQHQQHQQHHQQQGQQQQQQSQAHQAQPSQFHTFDTGAASLFDNIGLDPSTPSYTLGASVSRATAAGGPGFVAPFDALNPNDMRDRYFGVRR